MSTLLADRLRDQGIVTPDRHAALAGVQATPWWLAILLAIAAWIAALIIMGSFFGPLLALGDGPLTRAFGGGVLLGAALWLFRRAGPFFEQMALAFSLAGQGLLASAVLDGDAAWLQDADRLALTLLLIASALLVPRTSAAQRTVCVLIVLACLGYLIGWGMPLALYGIVLTALAAGLWQRRVDWAGHALAGHLKPLAHGATFAALCLAPYGGAYLGGVEAKLLGAARDTTLPLLYAAGTTSIWLAGVVWLSRVEAPGHRLLYLAAALAFALAAHRTPGLVVAATLLLATFHAGHRVWAGLTLACAFLYLGELYYNLEATLLAKSLVLMATGALLLAARFALDKLEGGAG
jgi:hypothetical protein